ncbi:hypothetical protein B0B36_27680 [Pseudomonas syringae pv. actinidifoliorum]|nr:hypothetical protein B0B36_27680 [Pseudomonas syringae pv. actinidifoliorum]
MAESGQGCGDSVKHDYRATLCVDMPFRTLRVLFATQSVAKCVPTLECGTIILTIVPHWSM